MELVQMHVLRWPSVRRFTSSGRVSCSTPSSSSHKQQSKKEKGRKQQKQREELKVKVEKRDADWMDDGGVDDRWKVRASDYFKEDLIRNTVGEDGTLIDWEGESTRSKCIVQEITSLEWENIAFHPSPLVVLVFQRYVRASDNWNVLKELEKAIQIFLESKKLPPRTVKIDAKIEKDLATALRAQDTPQLLFIRGARLLHRDTEVRTADDLVKMIAHFYYNAKRPPCLHDIGSF